MEYDRWKSTWRALPRPVRATLEPLRSDLEARTLASRQRRMRFHKDPTQLRRAYFFLNGYGPRALRSWAPRLYRRAFEFGYLAWPRKIRHDVHGAHVLEVGCGSGAHAVGYAFVGVRRYLGVDPNLDPDSTLCKDKETHEVRDFGFTPREIARRLPQLELLPGRYEEVAPRGEFDVAVLHNVTEHLLDIERVFRELGERVRPGGLLIYNHHNFHCWNGHHMAPKTVDDIDPDDPAQKAYVDWAHLVPDPERDRRLAGFLNRIRLDEIRALTDSHFDVETWDERPIDARRGAGRLTPEIRARLAAYTERELTTQSVFCRARRRV